ncbi:MAG: hypothetical protein WC300_02275, partial [Candidatus Omnitrophota bacterium]
KGKGLDMAFLTGKTWHDTSSAVWQVKKQSASRIIIQMLFPGLPRQRWNMVCAAGNRLDIDIDILREGKDPIICPSLTLNILSGYMDWRTADECGKLSVKHYINNIGPIRLKDNKATGIALMPVAGKALPGLLFKAQSQPERRILAIFKHKMQGEERLCLKSSVIGNIGSVGEGLDTCRCFKGFIRFGKNMKPVREVVSLARRTFIGTKGLRFFFDRGKGRLFSNGRELTSGLGVYTSVRVSGIWYDSYQALWQVLDRAPNKIIVSGDWPYLPISQQWQIEKADGGLIRWRADIHIHEKMDMEMQQANIMLSNRYKKWSAGPDANGSFSGEYTRDYDILPFRYFSGRSRTGITVVGPHLPRVLFKYDKKDKGLKAVIENTDSLYKSRLLQFYKVVTRALSPGAYPFFEGTIKVGEEGE